jgi:hypothetical protein
LIDDERDDDMGCVEFLASRVGVQTHVSECRRGSVKDDAV